MATRPGRFGVLAVLLAAMLWFGPAGLRGEVAAVGRIICAIRDGYAICTYAVGPQVSLGHLVTHPTEARLALALWADPDLNGVR